MRFQVRSEESQLVLLGFRAHSERCCGLGRRSAGTRPLLHGSRGLCFNDCRVVGFSGSALTCAVRVVYVTAYRLQNPQRKLRPPRDLEQ